MDFKEILAKAEGLSEEAKTNLQKEYDRVNRERGEFGAKLIEKDNLIKSQDALVSELKNKNASYSSAYEAFVKAGINEKDIPTMLEKLNFVKTTQDELEIIKRGFEETKKENKGLLNQLNRYKAEQAVKKVLQEEMSKIKGADGKPVKIADDFIKFDTLYDGINDQTTELVLQEKCKTELQKALELQTEVLKKIGFQGIATHKVGGENQPGAEPELDLKAIEKVAKEQGPVAAIAADRARRTKAKQ